MDATPNLQLPLIMPAQAQKHVTHNEALAILDAVAQLAVAARAAAPPPVPTDGLRLIVGPQPGGAFAGHAGSVASFLAGGWSFHAPRAGWIAYVAAEGTFLAHDGTTWALLREGLLSGLARLGIGASADDTNRLAVKSPAALLDHAGAGHQLKINKADAEETASLLFQTNYSGRAEMGLAGDDAFRIKASLDGAAWREVLRADPATGDAVLGSLRVSRDILPNLLPDSGRFNGAGGNAEISGIAYAAPAYLLPAGGTTIAPAGKYVADSLDHGGAGPALPAEIKALVEKLRPPGARHRGPEWFALTLTLGNGLADAVEVGGTAYGLALRMPAVALPARFTIGYHLRVLSGRALVAAGGARVARARIDGVAAPRGPRLVEPAEGWVHVALAGTTDASGLNEDAFQLLATGGAVLLLALPRLVAGHAELEPSDGLLMNDRLFG